MYHLTLWCILLMHHYTQQRITETSTRITLEHLLTEFSLQYFALMIGTLFSLPLIVFEVARYADSIQGPVNKFCNLFRSMTADEPVAPVQLRVDDLMQELAQPLCEYVPIYERDRLNRSVRERINRRNSERTAVALEKFAEQQISAGA